jgi:hypothetical protein
VASPHEWEPVDIRYGVVHLLVCCCSHANHPLRPQMSVELKDPAQKTKRLERLLNDPAGWTGGMSSQFVRHLLDALSRLLPLDLAYARLKGAAGEPPMKMVRVSEALEAAGGTDQICELFGGWFGDDPQTWAPWRQGGFVTGS